MTDPAEKQGLQALVREAEAQLQKGAVLKAMQIYYDLHERDPASVAYLARLADLNLHLELFDQAIITLQKLILLDPLDNANYDRLAAVFARRSDWEHACKTYFSLILRRPELPEAHFNLGYYQRRAGQFEEAIASYRRAIRHGIDNPAEAHLNIAVILADDLRRDAAAEAELRKALAVDPDYVPALYNLGNLYEDRGDRERTVETFERILSARPDHLAAMSRLAPLKDGDPAQDALLARMHEVGGSRAASLSDRIDALYAMGSVFDARQQYDDAFGYYAAANKLNALEMPPYDRAATERHIDRIIDVVSSDWVAAHGRDDAAAPVFVCGMFRSGSTLVDQLLAAHPAITAGGERDSIVREFADPARSYPDALQDLGAADLDAIARRYHAASKRLFPDAGILTDKRPDNLLYVGLLKALFPRAKIVVTSRHALDNCLSVYFVRLGPAMNYAVSLADTAHYYEQQRRLLGHWQAIFGDEIHVVDYDALIVNPRERAGELLAYLGLPWDDACLNFHELRNTVKTASAWQVRRPLYRSSSGRWRNYEKHLAELIARFPPSAPAPADD